MTMEIQPSSEHVKKTRNVSRREFLAAAAGAGAVIVGGSVFWPKGYSFAANGTGPSGTSTIGTGTIPEQIHLTWGSNPQTAVTVSWASPQPETAPVVTLSPAVGGQSVFDSTPLQYTDGLSGETVYMYHVPLTGLTPGTTYTYTISDTSTAVTFTSTFTTAPEGDDTGRFAFAFTSFGDLATPGAGAEYTWGTGTGETAYSNTYSESEWNSYTAVSQVEALAAMAPSSAVPLAPLFHLLNGDLAYGDKETINSSGQTTTGISNVQPAPEVWRDFGLNAQRSAANRPWMPCIGNHEAELANPPNGYLSYNTRFMLPSNGGSYQGSYYSFQVGSVLFISLDANDVCFQGAGAYNVAGVAATNGEAPTTAVAFNQFYTGDFAVNPNGTWTTNPTAETTPTSLANPNAQTAWLESTLQNARANCDIDWIIVQMHQCAMSSSNDNGCDAGIRQAWVPLFDQYQVDLVVNGHDHDYERSWPCRGFSSTSGTSVWQSGGSWGTSWPSTSYYGVAPGSSPTQTAPALQTLASTAGSPVNTFTPVPVTTDETSPFDTTQGTVYLVLGGGGTNHPDNDYEGYNPSTGALVSGLANVATFAQVRVGMPVGSVAKGTKPLPDASEPNAWSALRGVSDSPTSTANPSDGVNSYGIAYFYVDPGEVGGSTTITVTYYYASKQTNSGTNLPAPSYTVLETFVLTRPRSDCPAEGTPEFDYPDLVVPAGVALGAGALLVKQRLGARKPAEVEG